jgi:hypothetical protein
VFYRRAHGDEGAAGHPGRVLIRFTGCSAYHSSGRPSDPPRRVAFPTGPRVFVDQTASRVDGGDQFDDEDRARLHAAIEQAQDELDRGEGIPAAQFLAYLRSRRV